MGQFVITSEGRRTVLPNCFHYEGALSLWQRAFMGSDAPSFRIGVCGINIPNAYSRRPNHTYRCQNTPPALHLLPDTLYEHVADTGGHMLGLSDFCGTIDAVHARVIKEMGEQDVSMNVTADGGAARVSSNVATFRNLAGWSADDDPDLAGDVPLWYKDHPLSPDDHGFPWNTPRIWPGETDKWASGRSPVQWVEYGAGWAQAVRFPTTIIQEPFPPASWNGWVCFIGGHKYSILGRGSATDWYTGQTYDALFVQGPDMQDNPQALYFTVRPNSITADKIDANAWRATTTPLGCVYLVANIKLVASAVFIDDVRLVPGGSLTVQYTGRVRDLLTKGPTYVQ